MPDRGSVSETTLLQDVPLLSDAAVKAASGATFECRQLPAALVMSSLQASVRAFALTDSAPRSVVSQLNQALYRNVDLRRFVTFFYGVYDSTTRSPTYSIVRIHVRVSMTTAESAATVISELQIVCRVRRYGSPMTALH